MSETLINLNNTGWETGNYPLILGERLGLHDSINVAHPTLFDLYKRQKEIDWEENEVSLVESKIDMEVNAPKYIKDLMIKNLSYQWEFDSIASRSFATLLAPFITNSEFWLAQAKNQEIEGLHALTYSEIIRLCLPKETHLIIENISHNEHISSRFVKVSEILEDLQQAGADYISGRIPNDQNLFNRVFTAIYAMFLSERLQFMSSFATTFVTAEQGYFVGICKLIQKIATDELTCHAAVLAYVLKNIIEKDPRGKIALKECWKDLVALHKDVTASELAWNKYIFSEGRKAVGLTRELLDEWTYYNSYFAGLPIGITNEANVPVNPLPYMKDWLDIDSFQNANQEGDNTNYQKIRAIDDVPSGVLDFEL